MWDLDNEGSYLRTEVSSESALAEEMFHWTQNRRKRKSVYQRCALPDSKIWQLFPNTDNALIGHLSNDTHFRRNEAED